MTGKIKDSPAELQALRVQTAPDDDSNWDQLQTALADHLQKNTEMIEELGQRLATLKSLSDGPKTTIKQSITTGDHSPVFQVGQGEIKIGKIDLP